MARPPPSYEGKQALRLLWLVLPLVMLGTGVALLLAAPKEPGPAAPAATWAATLGVPALVLLRVGRLTLRNGKRIRLGGDEPERLAAWLERRSGGG